MEIGLKIRKFRLSRKVSQKELSEKIHVSNSFLNEIEKGKKNPSLETLFKIASFFEVTLSELLGETNPQFSPKLAELINTVKDLNDEQLHKLTEFIKSIK